MKKKKIVSMCAVVALATVAVGGATLAYFSDADMDKNVMTTANIKIVQNETDRNGDAYTDNQKLYPAVYLDAEDNPYNPAGTWEGPKTLTIFKGPDGNDMKMYTSLKNEIDKVVSVTNNGDVEAYVRTIILIENTDHMLKDNLHMNYSGSGWTIETDNSMVVDGQNYDMWVFTLNSTLAAGDTSPASLKQLWLDPSTDSDWYKNLGEDGQLSVIALSQASQVTGFDSAKESLNTAFGEVNSTNLSKWIAETGIDTTDASNVVGGGSNA